MRIEKAEVTHITFGKGIVVNQTENSIDIRFDSRMLTMQYPMAFDKFLKLSDTDLQEEIDKEVLKYKHDKETEEQKRYLDMMWEVSEGDREPAERHAISKKREYLKIFEDTLDRCEENDTLRLRLREINRNQLIIPETADIHVADPDCTASDKAKVKVSNKRSIEAASAYKDKKVCVLNMASAVNAGGKPQESASLEASLSRVSTLYKSLATVPCWEQFYKPHRKSADFLNNDDIIYTPGTVVFKTDTEFPEPMPEEDWFLVDVLTCAAPKLMKKAKGGVFIYEGHPEGISKDELKAVIEKRVERVFKVAHSQGAEVLILGAWGCDGSHNDKKMVACAFKKAVDKYGSWFETIEFAIASTPTKIGNLQAFQKAFGLEVSEAWSKRKLTELEEYFHEAYDAYTEFERGTSWAYSGYEIEACDLDKIHKYAVICENGIEGLKEPDWEEAEDAYRFLFMAGEYVDDTSILKKYPDMVDNVYGFAFSAYADWLCLYPRRLYELGMELRAMGLQEEAFIAFEAGGELNYEGRQSQYPFFCVADPCYELGNCYREGLGTEIDYEKAMRCYEEVCWDHDVQALPVMGDMYLLGQGVEQSYTEALKCYFRSEKEEGFLKEAISYGFNDQVEKIFTGYDIENKLREILANLSYDDANEETKRYLDRAREYLDKQK